MRKALAATTRRLGIFPYLLAALVYGTNGGVVMTHAVPTSRIMLEITGLSLTMQSKSAYRDEKFLMIYSSMRRT